MLTPRQIFERNVRVRLAVLDATISDVARAQGVSRQAVGKRLYQQRLSSVLLEWWSTALELPVELLLEVRAGQVADYDVSRELLEQLKRS